LATLRHIALAADSAANVRHPEPVAGKRVAFGQRGLRPGAMRHEKAFQELRLDKGRHFRSMGGVLGVIGRLPGVASKT